MGQENMPGIRNGDLDMGLELGMSLRSIIHPRIGDWDLDMGWEVGTVLDCHKTFLGSGTGIWIWGRKTSLDQQWGPG